MNKILLLSGFVACLLTSCASLNFSHPGVGRVKKYTFEHKDIPSSFNGLKIVFISDLHYKSLFKEKRLNKLVRNINSLSPDVLLLGGDYHEGCEYVPELFARLSEIKAPMGTYAVMGNNDYEACYGDLLQAMKASGVHLLEHKLDTLRRNDEQIIIAGIRNPFNLKENGESPTTELSEKDFVIMLVHTPDYAEDVSIKNTDLVLAGHTHGGQVTLFGLYAPIIPSKYGQRFRTGLKHNSTGIPVIITNGLGTSNKNIRMFAPSEIVLIRLVSMH